MNKNDTIYTQATKFKNWLRYEVAWAIRGMNLHDGHNYNVGIIFNDVLWAL